MDFENGVMYTQTAGYNGVHMVVSFLDVLVVTDRQNLDFWIPNKCGMKSLLFRSMRVTVL